MKNKAETSLFHSGSTAGFLGSAIDSATVDGIEANVIGNHPDDESAEASDERFVKTDINVSLPAPQPAPPWSPWANGRGWLTTIPAAFVDGWFADLSFSPTRTRHFADELRKRRRVGLAPEWLPNGDFSFNDLPHLVALALSIGPSAMLDLCDVLAASPNGLRPLQDALAILVSKLIDSEGERARNANLDALIGLSAVLGFGNPRWSIFLFVRREGEDEVGQPAREALRWIEAGFGVHHVSRFRSMWHPRPGSVAESAASPAPAPEPVVLPDPQTLSSKRPDPPPQPLPPVVSPEGVIITRRALSELRKERQVNIDRLQAGLDALGLYRAMRLGTLSVEDFRIRALEMGFKESACFADKASLRAFQTHYEVLHDGRKFTLDRHLKWGNASNAVTAIRIYFTYDVKRDLVVVGSMPRHLPVNFRRTT